MTREEKAKEAMLQAREYNANLDADIDVLAKVFAYAVLGCGQKVGVPTRVRYPRAYVSQRLQDTLSELFVRKDPDAEYERVMTEGDSHE